MRNTPSHLRRSLLIAIVVTAILTLVLGLIGMIGEGCPSEEGEPTGTLFSCTATMVMDTAALLTLTQPSDPPTNWVYALARFSAVLFALLGTIGVVLKLFRPLRMRGRRFLMRRRKGGPVALVVGLGWVGAPLARGLAEAGRPVVALVPQADAPEAARAEAAGMLVVEGDATEDLDTLTETLELADEVFIATGDAVRNVEVAGELRERADRLYAGRRGGKRVYCYVHLPDPDLQAVFAEHPLFRCPEAHIAFRWFDQEEITARDLLFHPFGSDDEAGPVRGLARDERVVPQAEGEVQHVFLVGFGGQAQHIARAVGRFCHYLPGLRPRLTVIGQPDEKDAWKSFLHRTPGFTDSSIRALTSDLPASLDYWHGTERRTLEGLKDGPAIPVRHAVNADAVFAEDAGGSEVVEAIGKRLGAHVRPVVVVAQRDDRASFQAALRLRDRLSRAFFTDEPESKNVCLISGAPPFLPIYVHLPKEEGLEALLRVRDPDVERGKKALHAEAQRVIPLVPFGQRRIVSRYANVTQERERVGATLLHAAYQITRGSALTEAPQFDQSNRDAALFKLVVMEALGLQTARPHEASTADPLLAGLSPEEGRALRDRILAGHHLSESDQPSLKPELERLVAMTRERLDALHADESAPDTRVSLAHRAALMEHNRWMGERLLTGWMYGARSDTKRQRTSLVDFHRLSEEEQDPFKDEQQLSVIALDLLARGLPFYCMKPKTPAASEEKQRGFG